MRAYAGTVDQRGLRWFLPEEVIPRVLLRHAVRAGLTRSTTVVWALLADEDGRPRRWNGIWEIAPCPEGLIELVTRLADSRVLLVRSRRSFCKSLAELAQPRLDPGQRQMRRPDRWGRRRELPGIRRLRVGWFALRRGLPAAPGEPARPGAGGARRRPSARPAR